MVPGDDSESSPSEDDTALRTVVLGLRQTSVESLETDRRKINDEARGLMARIDSFAAAADAYVASLNP